MEREQAATVTAESNAQQSKSEAEQADIATQVQKIELGNKYKVYWCFKDWIFG